ncbi:MAG: NUDIX domain-containing protein [Pedobacter sp.]|nr:MAG: NUDIX domain-containing protein [Pedobacter sp.]
MSYFNVRVYGLLINENNEVLLSDEREYGTEFTKFPGGGVELGEGLIDALKREFVEECEAEIDIVSHFYTTDFYEKSSFNESQVISIYYKVQAKNPLCLTYKMKACDFDHNENQCFRWVSLADIKEEDVTFRTDKRVVELLKEEVLGE